MNKRVCTNKLWLIIGLCLWLSLSYSNAFAWGSQEKPRGQRREVVIVGHQSYHYHDGRFYRPGWFGFEFMVNIPPIGAIVTNLPFGYRTIIVKGTPYYYCNNVYYRSCPSGYIVVPESAVTPDVVYVPIAVQPQPLSGETITINVPNANGSYTPVVLVKRNSGYVGPQGEYYSGNPTVDQLKALYGK